MQSQHTNHQQAVSSKLNKFDLAWVLNLFELAYCWPDESR